MNSLFDLSQQEEKPVLVLGSSSVDIVGRIEGKLIKGASNPANIRTSFGGTARNFAENLARLGHPVTLLSVVGKGQMGRQMLRYTTKAGVDTKHILRSNKGTTGAYLAVVNAYGELQFALDDMDASQMLTPEYLQERAELFEQAALLFLDVNLPNDTLDTAMRLAAEANLPVAADPTTLALAPKLIPYLSQVFLITPNYMEAGVLCEEPVSGDIEHTQGLDIAKNLVKRGVKVAIVTMAEFGVSYATSETSGHIPAVRTQIIDPTGGGDALSATVIYSLLNGIPLDEAIRLGVSAASLTLRHRGAVYPDLTLELLYEHLL
jgi:pseudouridine kinase